eukprot:6641689-Pyramimonas_sp.AAC.1
MSSSQDNFARNAPKRGQPLLRPARDPVSLAALGTVHSTHHSQCVTQSADHSSLSRFTPAYSR